MIGNNRNIELFNKWKVFDQIHFLDNFFQNVTVEKEIEDDIEKLLFTAIKDSSNIYVKRTAVKILCDLTLAKKYSKRFASIGLIIDLLSSESTLQSIALKYLPFFPEAFTSDTLNIIKELSDSSNGEVASQAYLCLGLSKFTTIIGTIDITKLISNITEAKSYLKASENSTENRIDAEYFLLLIDWIEEVLAKESNSIQTAFNSLEKCLLVRSLYEMNETNLELDYLIFQVVQKIKESYEISKTSEEWFDIPHHVQHLFNIGVEINKIRNFECTNQAFLNIFYTSTFEIIQDSIYKIHLASVRSRMQAFKSQSQDNQLTNFIESLLAVFPNNNPKKEDNLEFLALLSENIGSEDGLILYEKIINKDVTIEKAIAGLLQKNRSNQLPIRTGSINGQDVLFSLMSQIDKVIPDYPLEKREIFFNIVEEIIRYVRSTLVGHEKKRFLFLYSASENGKGKMAVEQDLQDSMYTYFEHSNIADGLDHEKAKFVDGGRVDIVYKRDLITIPVELKKSTNRPDTTTLEQNYIAQAQTYTAGYDQLGIFVLLELSDKSKEPPPNFKDWFKIHHLPPSTSQNVEYPDYLISVVIPGNRTTPSAKSVYK